MNISKRGRMIRATAAVSGVALLLAGCAGGGGDGGSGSTQLRFSSYGDTTKLGLRSELLETYSQQNEDGITVQFEGTPTADYWDKLATQFAGNNAPDIVNIDAARVAQYGGKGALAPLDDYLDSIIDTSVIDENLLAQGQFDGKQYGIPVAMSMMGWGYDATVLDDLGLAHPDGSWTWDDYADLADEIYEASGGELHGSEDASGDIGVLEVWLRSQGEDMWEDGEFVVTPEHLEDWFTYWSELRESGGIVPAEEASLYKYGDWPNSPIATKTAALAHIFTPNIAGGFRANTDHQIGLVLPPVDEPGGPQGSYADPSSLLSISTRTEDKEAAAKVIDWFVNSEDSALKLRLISGPPASSAGLDALLGVDDLTDDEKEVIEFTQASLPNLDPGPEPEPAAHTAVSDLLMKFSQDIAFGRVSVSDGVADLLVQVEQAVSNS
ncbi:ABC transporter substrate-binding protein [Microbacterium tumbae]